MMNISEAFQCCKICGGKINLKSRIYDDRYGYSGYFDLYKCCFCGHGIINFEFATAQLTELYTDHYPRSFFDVTKYKPAEGAKGFIAWLDGAARSAYCWVPEKVRVLDIGCGFGETLGYHKLRGCDAYGVEADENIRRYAEKYGFNVHVGLFDPEQYEEDFFDYVTLDQVIEHVTDPVETLRGVARVLKPGGVAILSTPNSNGWGAKVFGNRWINWHAPYHLHHFSDKSMHIAAEKAGIEIEWVKTLTSSDWLHHQWNHALIFPRMGEPSPYWSPEVKRGLMDKLILAFLSVLHRTKINHLITRLCDTFDIGDNYLFFMRKS
ncbi:MAG: class I SAM-dependent methyltransferase [Desulfuromonadaceae bacterium]